MAKKKIEDLRQLQDAELEHMIANLRQELFKLRAESKGGQIEKPHKIPEAKRTIARCNTIIRERKK